MRDFKVKNERRSALLWNLFWVKRSVSKVSSGSWSRKVPRFQDGDDDGDDVGDDDGDDDGATVSWWCRITLGEWRV